MTFKELQNLHPDLSILKIQYKHGATGYKIKREGIDIMVKDFCIISIEPCEYSNGDKWFVRYSQNRFDGLKTYYKRITSLYRDLNTLL